MGDFDLMAFIQRVISDDASQRIDRILTGLRTYNDPGVIRDDFPSGGVCHSVSEIPAFRKAQITGRRPYYFQYGGRIHWMSVSVAQGCVEPPWYGMPYTSYRQTPYLDYVLWKEYTKDPIGPRVPAGYTLETIGNKRGDHKLLQDHGCYCNYKYLRHNGDTVGLDRAYSQGFIYEFGLPEQETVVFASLDDQIKFLQSLSSNGEPVSPINGRGNQEHAKFLTSLKAECLAIRDRSGPSHGRAAFEVYKTVAKYLSPESA